MMPLKPAAAPAADFAVESEDAVASAWPGGRGSLMRPGILGALADACIAQARAVGGD